MGRYVFVSLGWLDLKYSGSYAYGTMWVSSTRGALTAILSWGNVFLFFL